MSFDTLLSLLFLLVFIVLPLLSRVMRQRSQPGRGAPPGRGSQAPGRPQPPSGDATTQTQETAPPWLAEAQRRVREARGQAQPQASAAPRERSLVPEDPFGPAPQPGDRSLVPEEPFGPPPRPGDRSLVPDDPFGRRTRERPGDLVPEDPFGGGLAPRAPRGGQRDTLGREGTPVAKPAVAAARRAPPDASEAGRRASGPRADASPAPAHGRRRRTAGGARLGSVDLLRFDRRAIVNGLIWHEILDEPAWKRRQRRASSRPRSR